MASLARSAPEPLDLADGGQLEALRRAAEPVEAELAEPSEILAVEEALLGQDRLPPGFVGLAPKLAPSRRRLAALREPVHVTVVLAVYEEQLRIRRRSAAWRRARRAAPSAMASGARCGFKVFRAEVLRRWIEETVENRFAFDIEFLPRVWLDSPDSIIRVPIAWIGSEAASTTAELQSYLSMLRSAVAFYGRYLPAGPEAERYVALIESGDEAGWRRLLERVPPGMASREPVEFDRWAEVGANQLEALRDG
jgi:hypothetical protein